MTPASARSTRAEIVCYSVGPLCISACAPKDLALNEVEVEVDAQHPTGLDHGWKVAGEAFRGGHANPCECETDPSRRHWLLTC